jgi:hypothetical protein
MRESAGRGIGVSSFCQKEELVSVHFAKRNNKKRNWCQFILPKETMNNKNAERHCTVNVAL